MSGTFNHIDVPPTLVSFAVDVAKQQDIITGESKTPGDALVLFSVPKDEFDIPVYKDTLEIYDLVSEQIHSGRAKAAYVVDSYGIAAAVAKMGFGNGLGASIAEDVTTDDLFAGRIGDIILEMSEEDFAKIKDHEMNAFIWKIGTVTDGDFIHGDVKLNAKDALDAWIRPLDRVFPHISGQTAATPVDCSDKKYDSIYVCKNKVAKPRVFIPVFPGSNCEYDSARAFKRAGAEPVIRIFRNQNAQDIKDSAEEFAAEIAKVQMIMFPGGFSAGDEPDGSAKFFATAFRNERMKEEVEKLLNERDGLVLGICNGFQALIKLGLVPEGKIVGQDENSPTLTFNTINRHISKMAYLRVCSNKSPWLAKAALGGVYTSPASHGEGRFVAPEDVYRKLYENGQIATRYCDPDGRVTMDEEWNINGSIYAVEGITSPDGRVFGKMCHSERRDEGVAMNIYGEQDMLIFESGVEYFK